MNNYTWANTVEFVTENYKRLGGSPSREMFRMLGAQALRAISEATHCYKKSWTNSAQSDLVISGNVVTLPPDVMEVDRVEWNNANNPLDRSTEEIMDAQYGNWRMATGDPTAFAVTDASHMVLSTTPTGTTTGKLTVRGVAYLPDFSDVAQSDNPLSFIPAGCQLAPAYYILANLPLVVAEPVNDSREAIAAAQAETNRRQAVMAQYASQFEAIISRAQTATNRKIHQPFVY